MSGPLETYAMRTLLAVSPRVSAVFPSLPVFAENRPPYPVTVVRLTEEVSELERFLYGARYTTCASLEQAGLFVLKFVQDAELLWTSPALEQLRHEYTEFLHARSAATPESYSDHFRT